MTLEVSLEKSGEILCEESQFICYPSDIGAQYKINLQNVDCGGQDIKIIFHELCARYLQPFLTDSGDVGNTNLMAHTDIGDSHTITWKSYNLPLKHKKCFFLG